MAKMKLKNDPTEKMIKEIHHLCNRTVDIEDWHVFEKKFEKILKKNNLDMYQICYGMTKKALEKQIQEAIIKYNESKSKRKKKNI